MKLLPLLIAMLLSSTYAGAQNLIQCETSTNDAQGNPLFRGQCQVSTFSPLEASFEGETFDALYTITLNSSCGKSNSKIPVYFSVGGVSGNKETLYLGRPNQTFVAKGKGSLTMMEALPAVTRILRLPGTCDITLQSLTFRPSSTAIGTWLESARSYTSRINLYSGVFDNKSEILSYMEIYIGSSNADMQEVGSILETIKSQLASDDPNVKVIDAILAGASIAEIETLYDDISTAIRTLIDRSKSVQRKLVFAQGAEDAVLKNAIGQAEGILSSPGI
jgi:hypothetical protein